MTLNINDLDDANDSTTAYGEGYQAYWEGEEENSNPYVMGTPPAWDWKAGWLAGQQDDVKGE